MSTNEEWLDSKIELLTKKITTSRVPFTNDIHRKIVDARNYLIKLKQLAKDIDDHTGINIIPHLNVYLNMP